MALCVRSVTNKIVPFKGSLTTGRNAAKLLKKISIRSHFLEDFLNTHCTSSHQSLDKLKYAAVQPTEVEQFLLDPSARLGCSHSDNSIWCLTTTVGRNALPIRKYTPTQDDMILWSRGAPNLYDDIKLNNVYAVHSTRLYDSPSVEFHKCVDLMSATSPGAGTEPPPNQENLPKRSDKPNADQLAFIHDVLAKSLPLLFVDYLNYHIYAPDLVYINNIRGKKTVGLLYFMKEMSLLKFVGHLKFAFVKMTVLKITTHEEDSSVRIRWRIQGVSALKVVMLFWKYKIWNLQKAIDENDTWYDGFSTMYVGGDGLVHTHIVDKVQQDDDSVMATDNKGPLATKLALLLGLLPRSAITDTCAMLSAVSALGKVNCSSAKVALEKR